MQRGRSGARRADRASPVERALVEALGHRYQANDPSADLVAWNVDYAEAMRDVYRGTPTTSMSQLSSPTR